MNVSLLLEPVLAALDDPEVSIWALNKLDDFRRLGRGEDARRLAEAWFGSPEVLRRLLSGEHPEVASTLLGGLDADLFSPVRELLLDLWPEWTGSRCRAGAQVLAALAPEEAAGLFRRRLEEVEDTAAAEDLARAFLRLPDAQFAELAPLFVTRLPSLAGEFALHDIGSVSILAQSLLSAGREKRESGAASLAKALTGHAAYFWLVADFDTGRQPGGLESVAELFQPAAPLAELDRLVRRPPEEALPEVLSLLAREDFRPARKLLESFGPFLEAGPLPEDVPQWLRNLGAAVLAAAWARPAESFAEIPWNRLIELAVLDVPAAPFHRALAGALAGQPLEARESIVEELAFAVAENQDGEGGARLAEVMSELDWPELIPLFVDCLGDGASDRTGEVASAALARYGAAAEEEIVRRWAGLTSLQQYLALGILEASAGPAARRFFLESHRQLAEDHLEEWCWSMVSFLEPRSVDFLAAELDREFSPVDEAFYVLCRLLAIERPELPEVAARLAAARAKRQAGPEGEIALDLDVLVDLRCPACGGAAAYRVHNVYLDLDAASDPPLIGDELACRTCGELADFAVTPQGLLAIQGAALRKALRARAAAEEGRRSDGGGPIHFATTSLADGRVVSLSAAFAHYRERLALAPDDPEILLSLGNCHHSVDRRISAERYFRRCLDVDPTCVEAAWGLSAVLLDGNLPRQALEVLQAALVHERRWRFFRLLNLTPGGFRRQFAEHYRYLRQWVSDPDVPPPPASLTATPVKVGRNDPCPCGSGKKSKKCCGRSS